MFATLLCLVFVIAGGIAVFADQTVKVETEGNFADNLNSALATPHGSETLRVIVPEGTYRIDKNIYIYSNTVLDARGSTFKYTNPDGGTMLKGAHICNGERCRADEPGSSAICKKGGYTQVQNVTVNGGTWDAFGAGSSADTQCIMFRHAQNITLTGINVKRSTNHMMNISGVNGAEIAGCTFTDSKTYTGSDPSFWGDITEGDDKRYNSMEAIHLDFTCKTGEPNGKPLDNTPCVNITVENCTFNGVFSGVGTHHANAVNNKRADNIEVRNCTFTNLRSEDKPEFYGRALTFYTADTVKFHDNKVNGVYNVVKMNDVSDVQVYSNTNIKNVKGNAFYIENGSKGAVKNNEVISPLRDGVWVGKSPITIYNNTIKNAQEHGIFVQEGTASTKINCNTITSPKKTGVYVNKGTTRVYKNTISGSTEQGVFLHTAGASQVDENTISNSTKEGIYVYQSGSAKVLKNTINSSKSNGVGIMNSKTVIVKGNTVTGSANNGMNVLVSAAGKTVTAELRENTVNSSKGLGILVQDGTNCVVYKNTVKSSTKNGIQVQGSKKKCTGTTVAYNVATGNKGAKDILINTKCNNTKVQFNTIPKSGRLYCFGDGSVLNKGNHYSNAVSIKTAKISGITNRKYTGSAQGQPNLKVVMNGKTLKKGTHYKLTFENNVKKGTAKVHIIGQGAYKDFVTKTFLIK